MNALNRFVAMVLIIAIALTASPAPLQAQSNAACDTAIARLETETRKLSTDLDEDVRAFVKDEAVENGLTVVRNRLKEKPASEAVFDLRDKWQKFNSWAEATKAYGVTMEDLGRCINTRGCSLIEFARRQNKVIQMWIQSLAEKGLGEAGARVAKASSIIKNYVDRTLTTATSGTLAAVNSCMARYEQQATTNNAVNQPPQQTPQGGGAKVSGGGGGGSNVLMWTLIGVAGAAGAVAASTYTTPTDDFTSPTGSSGGGSTGGGSGGGGSSTAGVTYQATVVSRSCVPGANAPEPCAQFNDGGTCTPTNFTFTVSSNGTVQSACGGYLTGTVSGTSFTGNYNGSCGNASFGRGPAVTGIINSTSGQISGTNSLCLGNSYSVSINVTRR